jgi:hypothetical protein
VTDGYPDALLPTSNRAALLEALETTPRLPRDLAAVKLALHYADLLDDATDRLSDAGEGEAEDGRDFGRMVAVITRVGPRYEAMLDRLGMSPGARPVTRDGESHGGDPASAELDRLRADSAAGAPASGVDYAAFVDPSVTEADTED